MTAFPRATVTMTMFAVWAILAPLGADALHEGYEKASKCCCQAGACESSWGGLAAWKEGKETIKEAIAGARGSEFCCKPRKGQCDVGKKYQYAAPDTYGGDCKLLETKAEEKDGGWNFFSGDGKEDGSHQCAEKTIRVPQETNGECVCDHKKTWGNSYQCSECVDKNVWGYGCDLPCPKICSAGCDFTGDCACPENCAQEKGGCLNKRGECQACKTGFAGLYCELPCPSNCGPSPEGKCSRGKMCYSCAEGWYGEHCDIPCPQSCPDCMMKDGLFEGIFFKGGSCKEQCKGHVYGQTCDKPCPANCDESVGTPSCERADGACKACAPGFWGPPMCDKNCGDTNCARDLCSSENGKCTAGCQEGFFGEFCDLDCPSGCDGACDQEGVCGACREGRTGGKCEQKCHGRCGTCKQFGLQLVSAGTADNECTKCHPQEPVELKDGKCECILRAEFDEQFEQCVCTEPEDNMREAFFEMEPVKNCRTRCKNMYMGEALREVFSVAKGGQAGTSRCISTDLYRQVVVSSSQGHLLTGSDDCSEDEYPVTVAGSVNCLHKDFVDFILQ